MKLYVGNLSYSTTQDALYTEFGNHGQVEEVAVVTDRETGRPLLLAREICTTASRIGRKMNWECWPVHSTRWLRVCNLVLLQGMSQR